jgi:hypothetical protein
MHSPAHEAGMLPALVRLCRMHIDRCAGKGVEVTVVSSRRSVSEQTHLFQKGRELRDGVWVKTGRVVTNALPEKSPHCPHMDENGNIGSAAYDLCIVEKGKRVFNVEHTLDSGEKIQLAHPAFRDVVGPEGEALGLVWGHRFHSIDDLGHFELFNWRALPLGIGDGRASRHGLD